VSLEQLQRRARELGAPLDPGQVAAFELYRAELLEWNKRVNLTAVTEPDAVEIRHFVDSLSCLAALPDLLAQTRRLRVVDVGSGAGFPGLPLKIAVPRIALTLVDSVAKKTAFLEHIASRLQLADVAIITARTEVLGQQRDHREQYDVALARALAPLPVLLELCLPLVRIGGRLVAQRRGDLAGQQAAASPAVERLGGRFLPPLGVDLGPDYEGYGLVIVDKVAPTPSGYPRRVGLPSRRPIR
jgi:16S rRNA (guanine527-N7)-methyltransferase